MTVAPAGDPVLPGLLIVGIILAGILSGVFTATESAAVAVTYTILLTFFIGTSLTGADIQMSFVGEMAKVFGKLEPYPNLAAWLGRMHARPAFQRSIEKGGPYRFA